MSKLLINERPIQMLPGLATKIGGDHAVVLQQVHYWLDVKQQAGAEKCFKQGRWWVYNSIQAWQETNFPWISPRTLERVFTCLEKMGLLLSEQFEKRERRQRKWYSIDYEAVEALEGWDFVAYKVTASKLADAVKQRICGFRQNGRVGRTGDRDPRQNGGVDPANLAGLDAPIWRDDPEITPETSPETTHTDPEGVCTADRSASPNPNPNPSPPVEPPASEPTDRPAESSSPSQKYDSGFSALGDVVGSIALAPPPAPALSLVPDPKADPSQKPEWGGKYEHPTAKFDARMRAATVNPGAKSGTPGFHVLMRERFQALVSIGDEAWKLVEVDGDDVNFTELAIAGAQTIMPPDVPIHRVKAHLINKAKGGSRTELRNLIAAGEAAIAKKAPPLSAVPEALPFIPSEDEAAARLGTKKDPAEAESESNGLHDLRQMYHEGDDAASVRFRRMGIAGHVIRDLGIDLETVRGFILGEMLTGELRAEVGVSILVDTLKLPKAELSGKLRAAWDADCNAQAAAALNVLGEVVGDAGPEVAPPQASTGPIEALIGAERYDFVEAVVEINEALSRMGLNSEAEKDEKIIALMGETKVRWQEEDAVFLEELREKLQI